VIFSQLAVDASKIPVTLVVFFSSRVLKEQQFSPVDFSLELFSLTFNRRTEVLVPDAY